MLLIINALKFICIGAAFFLNSENFFEFEKNGFINCQILTDNLKTDIY